MSYQLEVVKFRDVIPVRELPRFIPGLQPLTLEVIGDDFTSVEEVFVNGALAPEFIIVNGTTMWVQLPEAAQDRIDTIEVVSSTFTAFEQSKLSFKLGDKTKVVDGPQKLMQLFVKWLLQTPGSDIFNPERGGGLQELAGKVTTTKRMEPIMAAVTRAIDLTSKQIKRVQVALPSLPLRERLLSAEVGSINVSSQNMEAHLRVQIRTMSGEGARSSLQL